jgi:polyhydroxyalkanoate synthase subunit PhaC
MARRTAKAANAGLSQLEQAAGVADPAKGERPGDELPKKPRRKRAVSPTAAATESVNGAAAAAPKPRRPRKPKAVAAPEAPKAEPTPAAAATRTAAPTQPMPTLAELMMSTGAVDLERLSINLAEAVTRANAVLASSLQTQPSSANLKMDPFDAQGAVSEAWTQLASHPETLAGAQADLWMRYATIWQAHATRWMIGGNSEPPKPVNDKRFRDPEWADNPYFSLLRDTYLTTADWITGLISQAEGLDEATRRKATFFVKQAVDAASPSNFLLTNPTALRATLQSKGENLVKGLENLSHDLERGKGALAITQTDMDAFKIGETIATTPGKVVFRNDLIELIQYTPTTETVYETPLLIFPPWINKFYILDLQEKNSFIRWLVAQGHTVFVASWVNPDVRLAEKTFEDYMQEGVFAGVDAALKASGAEQVNTVGYCIGGTLLATSLAYMARTGDTRIKSATFFAAQMDFELAGELLIFTDDAAIKYVEERIDAAGGFLDSQAMADTFNALRSNDLVWNYVVENYYLGKRPPPFDLLFWNADQTRMPRALHLFYLKRFYHDNALSKGELTMLGEPVSLRDVKTPIYMQSSKEDHIAPAPSVYRSAKLFGGPVRYMMAGSGHIAGVINPPAANKYQHWLNNELPDTLEQWQAGATEYAGSWWHDWNAWLAERSGAMVEARRPGDGEMQVLGDAPGVYVTVKSNG